MTGCPGCRITNDAELRYLNGVRKVTWEVFFRLLCIGWSGETQRVFLWEEPKVDSNISGAEGLKWTTRDRLQGWWTKSSSLNNHHFLLLKKKTQIWRHEDTYTTRGPRLIFNVHQHKDYPEAASPVLKTGANQTIFSSHLLPVDTV